ncbi:MAG: NUDIX domain-containing protein [Gemmataceae bacterium]
MPAERARFTYDYPRPALTADVIIRTAGPDPEVLLIQRQREPFAGQWALPGGFVDEHERLDEAAARELHEETGLRDVPLRQLFAVGDPGRDPRGWTVSIVYEAIVEKTHVQPHAGDDAAAVGWFSLQALPALAFDHAAILARADGAKANPDR